MEPSTRPDVIPGRIDSEFPIAPPVTGRLKAAGAASTISRQFYSVGRAVEAGETLANFFGHLLHTRDLIQCLADRAPKHSCRWVSYIYASEDNSAAAPAHIVVISRTRSDRSGEHDSPVGLRDRFHLMGGRGRSFDVASPSPHANLAQHCAVVSCSYTSYFGPNYAPALTRPSLPARVSAECPTSLNVPPPHPAQQR